MMLISWKYLEILLPAPGFHMDIEFSWSYRFLFDSKMIYIDLYWFICAVYWFIEIKCMLTVQYGYFDLILTMGTSCSMHHGFEEQAHAAAPGDAHVATIGT
jgi:hypothetical protein